MDRDRSTGVMCAWGAMRCAAQRTASESRDCIGVATMGETLRAWLICGPHHRLHRWGGGRRDKESGVMRATCTRTKFGVVQRHSDRLVVQQPTYATRQRQNLWRRKLQ